MNLRKDHSHPKQTNTLNRVTLFSHLSLDSLRRVFSVCLVFLCFSTRMGYLFLSFFLSFSLSSFAEAMKKGGGGRR